MRLFVILIFLLSLTSSAYACSCIPPSPPKEALNNSDMVFIGTVEEVNRRPYFSTADKSVEVVFNVSSVYKGFSFPYTFVKTSSSSASCGYEFEMGKEYIVYAQDIDGELIVSLCSRTSLLSDASEDIEELGKGRSPTQFNETHVKTFTYFAYFIGMLFRILFVL